LAKKAVKKTAPRLFGTDGTRAQAGQGPLSPECILALGRALGAFLAANAKKGKRPRVLIGVDPRPSADMVAMALAAGLVADSCDVHWPGMMSTPEVAFLAGRGFDAGVSVTASHNPAADNGIKIFGKDGRKLPEDVERRLEAAIASGKSSGSAKQRGARYGWFLIARGREYEEFIVSKFRRRLVSPRRRRLKVVFDMAFGARSIDLQILSRLVHSIVLGRTTPTLRFGDPLVAGAEAADNALDAVFMNAASPSHPDDHDLINVNSGSLHPQGCATAVRKLGADLGVCFDGDGDRCILVDENGEVRDGDHMLALLAADMQAQGSLKNNTVVGTSMANLGLDAALDAQAVKLVRTDVGDKHVAEAMRKHGATLGGEQSGHIIITDEGHTAGDGLYTALRVIDVILRSGRALSELCAGVRIFPQTIVNVKTTSKPPLARLKTLSKLVTSFGKELGSRGRINVRYSGTEPLLRIMVEAEDAATLRKISAALAEAAKRDLK
jgi:phosphoglucosamine mutase